MQEGELLNRKLLGVVEGEGVRGVEGGWAAFEMGVEGVLRRGLGDCATVLVADVPATVLVSSIDLRPGVAGLDAGASVRGLAGEGELEGVIVGVGGGRGQALRAEASDGNACGVEFSEGRESCGCAGIGVGEGVARELVGGGSDVVCRGGDLAEGALQPERPCGEHGIAEGAADRADVEG